MSEKGLNILVAVSGSDESALDPIRTAFQSCGIPIARMDLRSGRSMVLQYLSAYSDTDAVVLSQYQGSALLRVEEVDDITTMVPNARIVIVVDEQKGSAYMKELESCGIYTAVFEEDADYRHIAELIQKGRSKKDARLYYGVSGRDVPKEKKFEADNAVLYLSSFDGSIQDLTARMAILSKQLPSTSAMLEILAALSPAVFTMASRIERYADLCALVEENRYRKTATEAAAPDCGEKKKEGCRWQNEQAKRPGGKICRNKKITRAGLISLEGRKETDEVGFVATNIGVGCTTSAILFAHATAKCRKGFRVALVEFDHTDKNFETLCRLLTSDGNTSGLTSFSFGGVDYFFDTPYSKFTSHHKPVYDLVVYDFGCCDNGTIERYFLGLGTKFVVSSAKEWHYGELADFVKEVSPADVDGSFIYLFPSVEERMDMGAIKGLLPKDSHFSAVPYEPNPFAPGKKVSQMFFGMQRGTWKQKPYGKALHVVDKLGRKTVLRKRECASLALMLVLLVGVVSLSFRSSAQSEDYIKLKQQALSDVSKIEGRLAAMQAKNRALMEELSALDVQVYVLKEDVTAGTVITGDMVVMVAMKADFDRGSFLTKPMLGKQAAVVGLKKGTPLLQNMVAQAVETIEPMPEGFLEGTGNE